MNTSLFERHGPIAVISMNNPPVNSLGHALRQRIVAALDAAVADPAVRGIVFAGNDKTFSAGADVTEFGTPLALTEPVLSSVLAHVEGCCKPVVAAISGAALGGGLELAMACHARVALEAAKLGLPEILLGLIPGSGGTQRLPRLTGMETALTMIQSGQPQTGRQLAASGLLDKVVADGLIEHACTLANDLAERGALLPRARDPQLDATAVQALLATQRERLTPRQQRQPAYTALLNALAAATGPFEGGIKREREQFLQLVESSQSKALRHQFFAEREATKLPAALQATPRAVQTVAIIGAGTMGAGIAICALDAGFKVILLEQDDSALGRGQQRVVDHYQSRVTAGKLKASVAAASEARLTPHHRLGAAESGRLGDRGRV